MYNSIKFLFWNIVIKFLFWNIVAIVSYRLSLVFLFIGRSLVKIQGDVVSKMRQLLEKLEELEEIEEDEDV